MDYANIQTTIFLLRRIENILSDPNNYQDIERRYPADITLNQAIEMVGVDETNYSQNLNEDGFYPGGLERGKLPEIAWFIREAIRNINPEFTGLIFEWNAEPARTHQQILDVVASASRLAFTEFGQILEKAKTNNPITEGTRRSYTEVHCCGIKVQWFPALADKFVDQLDEIAEIILDEVNALGSVNIYMHTFPFKKDRVMIVTSWDQELGMLSADADLVAYQEVCGEIDIDGDGTRNTVLMPIPASEAETVH